MIILFLNHKIQSCGVYQYGRRVYDIIKKSTTNTYLYYEIENYEEYINNINTLMPNVIIYNYHRATMGWLNNSNIKKNVKNIAIPHETNESMFDYILTIDPDEEESGNKFNISRPIFENVDSIISEYCIENPNIKNFINYNEGSDVPIFGSFGFGFHNKGFDKIITYVNDQYDNAIIKLLITFAHFDPNRFENINNLVNICNSIERKPGVKLLISHEFFTNEEVLIFLSSNTCNIFLYDTSPNRGNIVGISSVLDYAISVNKPIVISDSIMFRNIYSDSICIYKTYISNAIENSKQIVEKHINKYSNKNLINKIDKIISYMNISKLKGIYYNSQKATCSIYESGLMVYNCLKNSPFYTLDYTENCDFLYDYDFAVINHHDVINFWITESMVKNFNKPVFCVVTEVGHSGDVISRSPKFYTAYIVLDSSINDENNIYGFPRPLEQYIAPTYIEKDIPIIGSFGFATGGKRWDKILEQVYKEFDNAIVRFNIPYATYIPDNNRCIDNVINKCNEVVSSNNNPNIKLEITHTNFTKEELIYWCSQNTINCFFYDRNKSHPTGLCATADQSITAERPLLVTGDNTFRHIHKYIDHFPNISIKEAIEQTIPGVLKMKEDWSSQNFTEKFENILVHYVNKYNQNKIKNNKPVIFGFEVSAYYYVHNFYQDANVTHILLNLFEEFKQTGKNAIDVNNETFGDTISGQLKYLYINLKKKDYSFELKQQEGVIISWNNIISFIEEHLTSEKSPPENLIEVSIGEIIDKYSILELKMRYISDEKKREDIQKEISVLEKHIGLAKKSHFYKILVYINDLIWKNTDKIKALSGYENDPNTFANISNEIFVDNQKRFRIKNYFNNKFSSDIKEHKSYSQDGCYIKLDEKIIYEKIPEINYLFVSYDCLYVDSTYESMIKKMFPNYNFNFIDLENANKDLMKTTVDICVYSISDKSIRPIFDFLPIKYKSGGKMGDYLNQLSVICEKYYETGRKGELYIYNLPNQGDHFGFGLNYAHKDTYNIIMSQKYISDYKIYNGEDVDIDLSSWRNNLKKIEKLYANYNWNIIYNKEYKIEWGKHQWIYAEINDTWKDRIIINNPYYRHLSQNAINQIRQLILQNEKNCIFISNEVDHYNSFIHNIGIQVEYYKPIDFEETCIIINSCKYGIFGFSAFAVIANGLHKSHYLIGNNWDDSYLVNRMKGFMPNILDIFV